MDVIDLDSSSSSGSPEPSVRVQPSRAAKVAKTRSPDWPLTPKKVVFQETGVGPMTVKTTESPKQPPVPSQIATPVNLIQEWKKIEDQLRCDICKQLLDVPVSLKCFHAFCSFCIRRYLELSGNDYCPSCRVPASSTDIRLEPRLAAIVMVLGKDRGGTRKRIRQRLRGNLESDFSANFSKNSTLNKQSDLAEFFKQTQNTSPQITRTLLPLYKNIKDKALRDMILEDGVECLLDNPSATRDELIRGHKEFVFHLQAMHDAVRMGMYSDQFPTRGGVAKVFNIEWRQAKGRPARGLMSAVKPAKKTEDSSESVQELTRQAGARMADQLRQAIAKRKARDQTNH